MYVSDLVGWDQTVVENSKDWLDLWPNVQHYCLIYLLTFRHAGGELLQRGTQGNKKGLVKLLWLSMRWCEGFGLPETYSLASCEKTQPSMMGDMNILILIQIRDGGGSKMTETLDIISQTRVSFSWGFAYCLMIWYYLLFWSFFYLLCSLFCSKPKMYLKTYSR